MIITMMNQTPMHSSESRNTVIWKLVLSCS